MCKGKRAKKDKGFCDLKMSNETDVITQTVQQASEHQNKRD